MIKRHSIILLFIALLLIRASEASDIGQAELVNTLMEGSAEAMLKAPEINSVSIGVYLNKRKYIGHFGELKKGTGVPPDDKTIYEIGSGSKTFVGALAAKAVLEGKLALGDEITKFMPKGYSNLVIDGDPIKVSHLLTHTAGLPNILPLELADILADFENLSTPYLMNTVLANYNKDKYLEDLRDLTITARPGARYSYSSAGTELMAHIIEQLYERDYETVLGEFVIDLNMVDTKISLSGAEKKRLAVGYHMDNPNAAPATEKLPWGAAGSMKSTVPDILDFLEFQLDRSNLIARESHKLLYQGEGGRKLAYQWNISNDRNIGDYLIHHGGVPSAQNYMLVAPQIGMGIFIITNQSGSNTSLALDSALDILVNGIGKKEF